MVKATDQVIEDRLVAAYDRGLLVPFIGAGMSYPACALWDEFVLGLEGQAVREFVRRAEIDEGNRSGLTTDEFPSPRQQKTAPNVAQPDAIERAARASRSIRRGGWIDLPTAVRTALAEAPGEPPPQTRKLASIYWPLVVTTNYDDLYVAAVHHSTARRGATVPVRLLGRSPADCQRVLISLRRPDTPVLWALQGYVGGQAVRPSWLGKKSGADSYVDALSDRSYMTKATLLGTELVIGHAEYRQAVLNSQAFRRAFAEVFRTRSLLFLGSGLKEHYFRDLISEVIELYGPSPLQHYAYLLKGEVDTDFLRDYFGIRVSELDDHDELPERLATLAHRVSSGSRWRQTEWRLGTPSTGSSTAPSSRFVVVRGELPREPEPGGCLVISAGGTRGTLKLSSVGKDRLGKYGHDRSDFRRVHGSGLGEMPIWQHRNVPYLLAVNARMSPWDPDNGARLRPLDPTVTPVGSTKHPGLNAKSLRDLRLVELAIRQILRCAKELEFDRVHSMLLAAGGHRTFPRSSSLLQMVRGWSRAAHEDADLPSCHVYVVEQATEVLLDVHSGRLDLRVGLDPEVIEFWMEVTDESGTSRGLYSTSAERSLLEMLKEFDVRTEDWLLDLEPPPTFGWQNWTTGGVARWETWARNADPKSDSVMSVERFGLLPGSVLIATKPGAEADDPGRVGR